MERREHKNQLNIFELTSGKDFADVVALESNAFKGEGEDAFTLVTIGKVGWILGIRDVDNNLIGAVEIIRSRNPQEGFIHGVAVDSSVQYQGIGNQLIAAAVTKARELGMTNLAATISPKNGPSLNACLNKNGFTATKFLPDCYGEGEDRFWVELDLEKEQTTFQQKMALLGKEPAFVEDTNTAAIQDLFNNNHVAIGVVREDNQQNYICLVENGAI